MAVKVQFWHFSGANYLGAVFALTFELRPRPVRAVAPAANG